MNRPKRGGGAPPIADVVGSTDKDETGDRMRARCCMHYRDGKGGDIRCRGQANLVPLPAARTSNKTYHHATAGHKGARGVAGASGVVAHRVPGGGARHSGHEG